MRIKLFLLYFLSPLVLIAQAASPSEEEIEINDFVSGSLVVPSAVEQPPLVIFIQGSGPTDRDGNQPFLKNDASKKLANGLAENGIASYRYDKRIQKAIAMGISEEEMRFDDFITDAVSVLEYFIDKPEFSKIIVLGHSQGSLVGMIAEDERADAFISIAGPGQPLDSILIAQVTQQMPGLKENVTLSLKELRETGKTDSYNPLLGSIFRPSVQPFLLSWIKYNPVEEISDLDIPVLLINGTNDLQVSPSEAQLLKQALPEAELVLLKHMNHVMKEIASGDMLENSKSYNDPNLPLHPELVPTIVEFIQGLE